MQAFQQPIFQPYGVQPTLPPGWVEHYTAQAQPYWFNTLTQQSSWVFPMAPAELPKKKKQTKKKIPGTHWLFVLTHDGYEFYYDRETKKSIWEMPQELEEPLKELKKLEAEKQKEQENKKRQLEQEEHELEAKRVKLEQEVVEEKNTDTLEQELDTTEMTEEDIMWQLQQMAEAEAEENAQEQVDAKQEEEKVVVEKVEPKDTKPKLTEEECIAQFNALLKERHISPFAMYSTEYPQLLDDPRFSLVPPNKQKSLFNKYCHALGEQIKQEKAKQNKKPEDEFKDLLESKVTKKMYWDDFRRKFKQDPRFNALSSTKEKEALFKDHVRHNLNKKRNPVDDYIELLKSTPDIVQGIRWRDAKSLLERDDRYHAIEDKDKREDLFRDYLEGSLEE